LKKSTPHTGRISRAGACARRSAREYSRDRRSRDRYSRDRASRERPAKRPRIPDEYEGERRLWVGGLPHHYEKSDILRMFEKFGPLVVCDPRKGFAFLEYEFPDDARKARDAMHGHEPDRGRVLLVEFRLRGQERVEHRVPERYVDMRASPPPRREYRRSPEPRRSPERRRTPERRYSPERRRRSPERRYSPERRRSPEARRSPERGAVRVAKGVKNWRLEIDGMAEGTEWQEIKDWGRDAGLRVEYTATSGNGRGVIEFTSRNEMERAEADLRDRPLRGVHVRLTPARVQPDNR